MKSQIVDYSNGASALQGEVFWDESRTDRRPGVVVFPEAWGLNDHCRERARRLAEQGYVAFAADLYGGGASFNDIPAMRPHIEVLYADRSVWRSRARAALDALTENPLVDASKTAAIGFCFGGTTCFELARSGAPLSVIVTFHAGLMPELAEDHGRLTAKVLICSGSEDPIVKREAVDAVMAELRRDKVDWQLTYYGNTGHSFTNPDVDARNTPGFAYSASSEARSWSAMRRLFDEVFL